MIVSDVSAHRVVPGIYIVEHWNNTPKDDLLGTNPSYSETLETLETLIGLPPIDGVVVDGLGFALVRVSR
jgi:hypothetical protein